MGTVFDPYRKWLGIPLWEQPADHYRLLGITPFENDPDVIEAAADRQMAHIRNYQSGQHSELSQKILNELANARVCLLNPEKKSAYDAQLRIDLARQAGRVQAAGPPFGFFVQGAARYFAVQTRRLWTRQVALPSVYLALGRDILAQGRYRDRLADLYVTLQAVTERLASIEAHGAGASGTGRGPTAENLTPGSAKPAVPTAESKAEEGKRPKSSGIAGSIRRFLGGVKRMIQAAFLARSQRALVRNLAQRAYQIDHQSAGPEALTGRVRDALTRLEECRAEIAVLSEVPAGTWLSPKRLAWIVLTIVVALMLLLLWARWMLGGP
jgi:hypothetical protein